MILANGSSLLRTYLSPSSYSHRPSLAQLPFLFIQWVQYTGLDFHVLDDTYILVLPLMTL